MEMIEINKDIIPYYFNIILDGVQYEMHVNYNSTGNLFTIGLYKDGVTICDGEPIVYGQPLWQGLKPYGGFPNVKIVALDLSGNYDVVTYDNFGSTVFLYIESVV